MTSTASPQRLTVVDLFCGAGGLAEGFRRVHSPQTRFDIVYGVDSDADAIDTFRTNLLGDLPSERREAAGAHSSVVGLTGRAISESANVGQVHVVIGGPNCQAVSSAGLRNLSDARNAMFGEYVRLIAELEPEWFVLENVPGLVHGAHRALLLEMMESLAALPGYSVAGDVLLAADYGVPQYRYRLFLVGTRTGAQFTFPLPTHGPEAAMPYRSVRDAIGDLTEIEPGPEASPANHHAPRLQLANTGRMMHVPPGGDWLDLPIHLLPARYLRTRSSDQRGNYGRLDWEAPAFTITSLASNVTAGRFTHPVHPRPLTPREAARLQGFHDGFVFRGSRESWYRQIGNAVPPPLAEQIALGILESRGGNAPGRLPRLTLDAVRQALAGGVRLPVLTPRVSRPPRPPRPLGGEAPTMARQRGRRPLRRLEQQAKQPGNFRSAKRARALMGYFGGRSLDEVAAELNVSGTAVATWIRDFHARGVEGWRAYHTSVSRVAGDNVELRQRLQAAVREVRRMNARQLRASPSGNSYLQKLVARFGGETVRTLRDRLIQSGLYLGTQYVDDLLAIADVISDRDAKESFARINSESAIP